MEHCSVARLFFLPYARNITSYCCRLQDIPRRRPLHITRHNSTLNFLAQSLKAIPNCSLYADLSPSIITGDAFRPDLLLVTSDHRLFIFELTVGYETNLDVNANHKREKNLHLVQSLSSAYSSIMFVNFPISSLGIFGLSCSSLIDMCNALDISENHLRFMISKLFNYIFCRRNTSWNNPELLQFLRHLEQTLTKTLFPFLSIFFCACNSRFLCKRRLANCKLPL